MLGQNSIFLFQKENCFNFSNLLPINIVLLLAEAAIQDFKTFEKLPVNHGRIHTVLFYRKSKLIICSICFTQRKLFLKI